MREKNLDLMPQCVLKNSSIAFVRELVEGVFFDFMKKFRKTSKHSAFLHMFFGFSEYVLVFSHHKGMERLK